MRRSLEYRKCPGLTPGAFVMYKMIRQQIPDKKDFLPVRKIFCNKVASYIYIRGFADKNKMIELNFTNRFYAPIVQWIE